MVDALKRAGVGLTLPCLVGILWVALACGGQPPPVAAPTPTPVPDPEVLLAETVANLRTVQSAKFHLGHEAGSMYLPANGAKITDIFGTWDAESGAELAVDAYLVSSPDADHESASYVRVRAIVTQEGYFSTEPLSGLWLKQPTAMAPVSVNRLQHIIADLVEAMEETVLIGEETVDGAATYRIGGNVPASAMWWLPVAASASQSLRIEVWTDTGEKLLRQLDAIGPVGEFDSPDTHRTILLTAIGEPVTIVPPEQFIDLTGD